ncbi:lipoprotein signal peptidase [Spirochaetia bacterium]|nr:lipoprotein signal peptidase [Spirochaetia bacterium]
MDIQNRTLVRERLLPLSLTALLILADQGVKSFIANHWPQNSFIKDVFNNELLEIIHVRNKAIAFSLGDTLPDFLRSALFVVAPIIVLGFLLWYYFKTDELTRLQRWTIAGIVGGGAGNLLDRIFRPDGVVDFISVKWFSVMFHDKPVPFLGFNRWPTFNIADAGVVVSVLIFLFTIILPPKGTRHE